MNYTTITELRWANAEQTVIACTVHFEQHGPTPFGAGATDPDAHGREIFERIVAGDFGEVAAYEPPPAPSHAELASLVLAKARALRLPIIQVLDGMQASAIVTDAFILVNEEPVALKAVIEDCKQALRDLPNTVDLSQCTTQQQMEGVVLLAYKAIVDAAPPEIKSAFDSLKP